MGLSHCFYLVCWPFPGSVCPLPSRVLRQVKDLETLPVLFTGHADSLGRRYQVCDSRVLSCFLAVPRHRDRGTKVHPVAWHLLSLPQFPWCLRQVQGQRAVAGLAPSTAGGGNFCSPVIFFRSMTWGQKTVNTWAGEEGKQHPKHHLWATVCARLRVSAPWERPPYAEHHGARQETCRQPSPLPAWGWDRKDPVSSGETWGYSQISPLSL